MADNLVRIQPKRLTGEESIHSDDQPLGLNILDFWSWSSSDLVSNATRGVFAEFLVARSLNIPLDGVRDEWGAYDLKTPEGITVEVKSAAFVQSWTQSRLSQIIFRIPRTRAWNAETNILENESRRQAQVYVFALLAHEEKSSIDPLNINQWRFFVLSSKQLDNRTRSQHSITLRSLESLAGSGISYSEIREAVLRAAKE
ncbi:MAG: hypothetical protein Q8O92_14040 [Candidatus Latescibacter sp.]|nr:hypothetical protein [Candidatus Latescibacter sp.]